MHENEISGITVREAILLHNQLGPGLLESVYEEGLCYKLIQSGLFVEKQKPIPLILDQKKMECGFRCDIMIENKVIVEIKAVEGLADIHTAQMLTYLKLTDKKLGLLINFNVVKLTSGIRRIVNKL